MTNTHPKSGAEHYDNQFYQRVVEIERAGDMGLTADEVYEKETSLAFAHIGRFAEGEGILDIASGAGTHARLMSDRLNHKVPIRGVDGAPALVAQANAEVGIRREQKGIRENLHFIGMDMEKITPQTFGAIPYKVITCLGSSFGYHNTDAMKRILKNLYNLLQPGGKLIVQYRKGMDDPDSSITDSVLAGRERLHVECKDVDVDGTPGMEYHDTARNDFMYEFAVDCPCPDESAPAGRYVQSVNKKTGKKMWTDTVYHFIFQSFARRYKGPDGQSHDFPPTMVIPNRSMADGAQRLFEECGFKNFSPEEGESLGPYRNIALIAEKPLS